MDALVCSYGFRAYIVALGMAKNIAAPGNPINF